MKRLLEFPLALILALLAAAAFAAKYPGDNPGTADHPEVPRFPGFHIDSSKLKDFNEYRFASKGYDGSYEPIGETKAGKHWFIDYILNEGARKPSAVELVRNYENAFRKAGGVLVNRHPKGGDPESAVYRMPRPNGGERWTQINIDNEGLRYQLNIVDVGAMAQKVEFSAGEMADAIRKNGFVALTGNGIDGARLKFDGKGDSVPVADNRSEEGRAKNRRVELVKR